MTERWSISRINMIIVLASLLEVLRKSLNHDVSEWTGVDSTPKTPIQKGSNFSHHLGKNYYVNFLGRLGSNVFQLI